MLIYSTIDLKIQNSEQFPKNYTYEDRH